MEEAVSLVLLGGFIWVVTVLVPKARRERDWFAVACALSAALVALLGWLLLGSAVRSK